MITEKMKWNSQGLNVQVTMPISKVDVERRIVSGFATLDNIDKQDDIVEKQASVIAFTRFRGNVREMHQPIAVGQVVSFKEDKYFDPESKKVYDGIFVSAYVSKGAQATWEKVLDGTLSAFSIGGNITKTEPYFDETLNKSIRVIKEYELFELSLVDSPANQFASVVSVQKVDGQNVYGGFLAKAQVNNVYYCAVDGVTKLSMDGEEMCPTCTFPMKNIGFVEKSDGQEDIETIKFLVDSAKGISSIEMNKEVSPMSENTDAVVDSAAETIVKSEVAPEAEANTEATDMEKAAKPKPAVGDTEPESAAEDATEPTDAEEKEKAKAKVSKAADEAVAKAVDELKSDITSAFSDLVATMKSFGAEIAELTKSLGVVTSDVDTIKGAYNEIGKRVDSAVQATAFRKSGDLGEIVQLEPVKQVQKSLWGGRFLNQTDLFN